MCSCVVNSRGGSGVVQLLKVVMLSVVSYIGVISVGMNGSGIVVTDIGVVIKQ